MDEEGNKWVPGGREYIYKKKDGTQEKKTELPENVKKKTTKDGLTYFVDEDGNEYVPTEKNYTFKATLTGGVS